VGKVEKTINIHEEICEKFSLLVIKEEECPKKNEVIEQLIKEYT